MGAPFKVYPCHSGNYRCWDLYMTAGGGRLVGCFPSQGKAIDYAYKSWPWWP